MKKVIFILITFVFFITALLVAEGALRLAGYGTAYSLFIKKHGRLHTNPRYAEKFSSNSDINIPELIDQTVDLHKKKNTVRIVALG